MLLISSSFPTGLLPPQYPTQRNLKLVDESLIAQRSSDPFVLAQCGADRLRPPPLQCLPCVST